jgi:protein-disulfide isomerase
MKSLSRALLVVAGIVGLAGCGATAPRTGQAGEQPIADAGKSSPAAGGVAPTPSPDALATSPSNAAPPVSEQAEQLSAGPVTPIMARLELSGEAYAIAGDPDAPITVIEFSDFG